MKKRTIFIGDIHGCFDVFMQLLKKLNYNNDEDDLYLTGDLINKGPNSFEVVDFLVNNPQIKSVKGNHEIYFLEVADGMREPQSCTGKLLSQVEQKHIDYIRNLPSYIETSEWILLHGGIYPDKDLKDHTEFEISTIRKINDINWYELYKGSKTIIYGHYAKDGLRIRKNTIGLDTAAVYGRHLTAYIRETKEIIQVSSDKFI